MPLQTTGLEKHWIQFDVDNIAGPPLRVNVHIQPAIPSCGPLDNSACSQTLPLEQSPTTRQELRLPEANQRISSSRLASLVLVQDEEAVHIKVDYTGNAHYSSCSCTSPCIPWSSEPTCTSVKSNSPSMQPSNKTL